MRARTVAIVQARMGSTRLPGKVMMTIGGRPLLTYLVKRISKARTLDAIVVATTIHARDSVIVEECERQGITCVRGSEEDVLGRYVQAAVISNAGIIVRVTGDNPFTDPDTIDKVVEAVAMRGADYAIEMNLPAGTAAEALTWNALTRIDALADTPRWREHVTLYAKENMDKVNCALLDPRPDCNRPDLSFTVDTLDEYVHAKELAAHFPKIDFGLKNLIAAADETIVRSFAS